MSIGERILELRKKTGLSQGELASMLDITRQAISKWENDLASPDTIKLIQLADALDTEVEYLATGRKPVYEQTPIVVNLVKKAEEPQVKVIEKVVERPVIKKEIKKITKIKYKNDPIKMSFLGFGAFIFGLVIGLLF